LPGAPGQRCLPPVASPPKMWLVRSVDAKFTSFPDPLSVAVPVPVSPVEPDVVESLSDVPP